MNQNEAEKLLISKIQVTRENIARAKKWILAQESGNSEDLVQDWLRENEAVSNARSPSVELQSDHCGEQVDFFAKAFNLRLAFYHAEWELITAAELFQADGPCVWSASLGWNSSHGAGGLDLKSIFCSYPSRVVRPRAAGSPSTDVDIFLQGIDCVSLHSGIQEAIGQAMLCFQRGLYMPATAMLAAAAEASWIECGVALAKKLGLAKLDGTVNDSLTSINKKVSEIQKTLQGVDGKAILKSASRSSSDVDHAVLWTTTLRERRNALHWGKAKSFVLDHSGTASLLMGAPLYIGTLEAIRLQSQ